MCGGGGKSPLPISFVILLGLNQKYILSYMGISWCTDKIFLVRHSKWSSTFHCSFGIAWKKCEKCQNNLAVIFEVQNKSILGLCNCLRSSPKLNLSLYACQKISIHASALQTVTIHCSCDFAWKKVFYTNLWFMQCYTSW